MGHVSRRVNTGGDEGREQEPTWSAPAQPPPPVFHLHTTMCHLFSLLSLLVRHVRLLLGIFWSQPSRLTLALTEHIYASTVITLLCETKLIYHVNNVISCYEYDLLSYLMLLTLFTVLFSLINITYLLFSVINIICLLFSIINIIYCLISCY